MQQNGMRVHLGSDDFHLRLYLYAYEQIGAKIMRYERVEPVEVTQDAMFDGVPVLNFPYELGERLMQELWDFGFRPRRQDADPLYERVIEAQEKHIADLKEVVNLLGGKNV